MILFQENGPASLREASRLRKELGRILTDLCLPDSVAWPLLVGVSEILANALQHAIPAPEFLGVRLDLVGPRLRLEVSDDGGSFCSFEEALDAARTSSESLLRESGRGLGLITDSFEKVNYESGSVNRFIAWMPIASSRPLALIVEDDDTLLDMYCYFLRDFRVMKARSIDEALLIINEYDVSVIVADLHLGDGVATQLLQGLQEDLVQSVPVILISGSEESDGPQDALAHGVELFLAKPVSAEQLRASVELAIARNARRSAQLACFFARKVDALLQCKIPSFVAGHDIVVARASASVGGGDLVVEYKLPGRRRIVLIDVMGHGVSAKAWAIAYASLTRGLCHALPNDDCASLLQKLAEITWNDRGFDAVIATALALDLFDDGHIEFASAGHPSPIVVGPGSAVQVSVGGALLGVLTPSVYESKSLRLMPGERLVLLTDGVDAGDVAAGGLAPSWLIDACSDLHVFRSEGRVLQQIMRSKLGAQPKDDWTVVVIGAGPCEDHA